MKDLKSPVIAATLTLVTVGAALASEISDVLPASSDNLAVYEEVGDWTVYSDATRLSCLAERSDANGNVMQMGMTKDLSAAYVGVFTLADIPIKENQPVEIAVDGTVFTGESFGIRSGKISGNYSGGYVLSNSPDFVTGIAEGRELVAFPEKTGLFVIDLTGTKRAIEEVKKCGAALRG